MVFIVKRLIDLGFGIIATAGTAKALKKRRSIEAETVHKVFEDGRDILDYVQDGKISLLVSTPSGRIPREDEVKIRSTAGRRARITTIFRRPGLCQRHLKFF